MDSLRICPHCGTANDKQVSFCGACATQLTPASTALVRIPKKRALPVLSQRDKATLGSIALGLAAVAFRVGSTVLKQTLLAKPEQKQPASSIPSNTLTKSPSSTQEPSVRIRRRWVINNGYGPPQWGEEEIEIHRRDDESGNYRLSFY